MSVGTIMADLGAGWASRRLGLPGRPRFLTWTVTWRCNARCRFCGSWRKPPSDELDADAWRRISDSLGRLHGLRITGGEPLVRGDLPEIVCDAIERTRPEVVVVSTNGLAPDRLERLARALPDPRVLSVVVSLDGVRERHDELRGIPGAWDRVMESLERARILRDDLGVDVATAQTVVDRRGVEEYPALASLVRGMGFRHRAVVGEVRTAMYDADPRCIVVPAEGTGMTPPDALDAEALRELLGMCWRDTGNWPWIGERASRAYWIAGAANRLLEARPWPRPRCEALGAHMRVLPDGTVPVCQYNTLRVGDLTQQDPGEVWDSIEARVARDWVRECGGCWAECEVVPSAVYSGDLLRSLPRLLGGRP